MDKKYIDNLGQSQHVDEGALAQWKAKAASLAQGAKNLAATNKIGGMFNPKVGTRESAAFNNLFRGFVKTLLGIIKNFDATISPWAAQHKNQFTPQQQTEISNFQTLETALKSIKFENLPVTEAMKDRSWFPTFGTVGAAASGGVDNIINAYKKKLASTYTNFLGDVHNLKIVPDQYIPNKIATSNSGAAEALNALGTVLGKDLNSTSSSEPTPNSSGTTVSPDAIAAAASGATPPPTSAPSEPATTPKSASALSSEPPTVPTPAPKAEPTPVAPAPAPAPASVSTTPEPLSKPVEPAKTYSTPTVTPPEAKPVTKKTSKPVATTPEPVTPKVFNVKQKPEGGWTNPSPAAPEPIKMKSLIPQPVAGGWKLPETERLKSINSKYIIPNGLEPFTSGAQLDAFYAALPQGQDVSTTSPERIKSAHKAALNAVAPVNKAIVPANDPDYLQKPEKPADLQRSAPELAGPDSPEMVDKDLTDQALIKIATHLAPGKGGKMKPTPTINKIRSELIDRNATKAEHVFDVNEAPIIQHVYANGKKAIMTIRYKFDKNSDQHSFEGNVELYNPQQAKQSVAEANPSTLYQSLDTMADPNGEDEKGNAPQGDSSYHKILQFKATDVIDEKGNLPPSFDVYTLIARCNPELGQSITKALKAGDVNKNYTKLNIVVGLALRNLEHNLAPANMRGDRAANFNPNDQAGQQAGAGETAAEINPKPPGEAEQPQPDQQGQTVNPNKGVKKKKPVVKEGPDYKDFYRF